MSEVWATKLHFGKLDTPPRSVTVNFSGVNSISVIVGYDRIRDIGAFAGVRSRTFGNTFVTATYPSAVTPDTPLMTRKKTFARDTHAINEARKPKFKIKATKYRQLLL
jgi:hypothetical protein